MKRSRTATCRAVLPHPKRATHYYPLGYKKLPRRQFKYLARVNDTVVGALSLKCSPP